MRKSPKFSPEVIERAVRMVFDAKDQYPSQWAAIESIAAKIGCTGETLRKWVRQGERDSGVRPGPTTSEQQRIKDLEREVRELRKTNEILKLASAYFAQAEFDRHLKSISSSSAMIKCCFCSASTPATKTGSTASSQVTSTEPRQPVGPCAGRRSKKPGWS
jgi:transposase